MSKFRRLSALVVISLSLSSCGMPGISPAPNAASIAFNAVEDYPFEVSAGFEIASVDSADQSVVDNAKTSFEADLKAGRTGDYQRDKDFSIHLLSGSEGNYFTSEEFIQNSVQQVLATLVVVQDGAAPQIFKGQFENQRFVFADPGDQFALDSRTKAYLLTAGSDFSIQTYKGELVPEAQVAAGNTAPSAAAVESGTVGSTAEAAGFTNRQAYNGVSINYDPSAEQLMRPSFPMFSTPGWPLNDKYAGRAQTSSRAWSAPGIQPVYGAQPVYGMISGRPDGPGEFASPFEAFDPYHGALTTKPATAVPVKGVAAGVPMPVNKSLARGFSPQPDPTKLHVAEAGWIDADGKFHPADKATLTRADEAKRPEAQLMRAEKRFKVQEPDYVGPDSPQ